MEAERITLSQRERDRLKVLHEVQEKHLSQVAAAERTPCPKSLEVELAQKPHRN